MTEIPINRNIMTDEEAEEFRQQEEERRRQAERLGHQQTNIPTINGIQGFFPVDEAERLRRQEEQRRGAEEFILRERQRRLEEERRQQEAEDIVRHRQASIALIKYKIILSIVFALCALYCYRFKAIWDWTIYETSSAYHENDNIFVRVLVLLFSIAIFFIGVVCLYRILFWKYRNFPININQFRYQVDIEIDRLRRQEELRQRQTEADEQIRKNHLKDIVIYKLVLLIVIGLCALYWYKFFDVVYPWINYELKTTNIAYFILDILCYLSVYIAFPIFIIVGIIEALLLVFSPVITIGLGLLCLYLFFFDWW